MRSFSDPTNYPWPFVRRYLPYCIKRLEDGRYIVLNRDYKPLGHPNGVSIDLDTDPSAVEIFGLTTEVAGLLSHKGSTERGLIHLYDDTCNPMNGDSHMHAYLARLAHFKALSSLSD